MSPLEHCSLAVPESPWSPEARADTLIYTQLVEFESDEYWSAVADNVDEAKKLIEAGFEYVCIHNEIMLFKKRK